MRPAIPHIGKASDQMPEEAPGKQVPDDVPQASEGAAREAARQHTKDARRQGSQRRERGKQAAGNDPDRGGSR